VRGLVSLQRSRSGLHCHGKSLLDSHYAGDGRLLGAGGSSAVLIITHVGSAIMLVLSGVVILQWDDRRGGPRPGIGTCEPALDHAGRSVAALAGLPAAFARSRPIRRCVGLRDWPHAVSADDLHHYICSRQRTCRFGTDLAGTFGRHGCDRRRLPTARGAAPNQVSAGDGPRRSLAQPNRPWLEIYAAIAVILLGLWPLTQRQLPVRPLARR
jgi:hypothetical protein